jgi:hypothetical protein
MWTWLRSLGRKARQRTQAGGRGRASREKARREQRPWIETLEDRTLPSVSVVSTTDPHMLSDTAAGNVTGPGSVSADGQFLVYTDTAANLAPGQVMDSKSAYDVFLYDRGTGKTTLVSHAFGNTAMTATGTSRNAAISADGKWVAYVSNSDDLISGETLANDTWYVNLWHFTGGTFTLSYGGQTTSGIPYNATPAVVQTALTGLTTVGAGNATVTGSVGFYTITFTGALANAKSSPLSADGSALTSSVNNPGPVFRGRRPQRGAVRPVRGLPVRRDQRHEQAHQPPRLGPGQLPDHPGGRHQRPHDRRQQQLRRHERQPVRHPGLQRFDQRRWQVRDVPQHLHPPG